MLLKRWLVGDPLKIVSVAIYGATLVALYTSSTVYHSVTGRAKAICRKIDHTAIYLLIAKDHRGAAERAAEGGPAGAVPQGSAAAPQR